MTIDRKAGALAAFIAISVLAASCAPKQIIPLDCVPKDVTLYVDKQRLDAIPDELRLSADKSHYLYFKKDGYQPVPVVLETEDADSGPRLTPADICVEIRFVELQGELELEIEDAD